MVTVDAPNRRSDDRFRFSPAYTRVVVIPSTPPSGSAAVGGIVVIDGLELGAEFDIDLGTPKGGLEGHGYDVSMTDIFPDFSSLVRIFVRNLDERWLRLPDQPLQRSQTVHVGAARAAGFPEPRIQVRRLRGMGPVVQGSTSRHFPDASLFTGAHGECRVRVQ